MSHIDEPTDENTSQGSTPPRPVSPAPTPGLGLQDSVWSNQEWSDLLNSLVETGICTWKEVAALVLGHLNPSQVGTSLASSEGFKLRYGKGKTMEIVMRWAYDQTGKCADCGTRLELQADHIKGKEEFPANPLEADFIENMTLRCRRCNVVRRPSHEYGGLTFLTAEAALMWMLFVIRPRTRFDYIRMCRLYGMTMADIRMDEAWAMAHWLASADPPAYDIEKDNESSYDLVSWPDSAITRMDPGAALPRGAVRLCANVPGTACLGFISIYGDGRPRYHEQPLSFVPFSTYELGARPPQALCIRYSPPDRKNGKPQVISELPPRGTRLLVHAVKLQGKELHLESTSDLQGLSREKLEKAPPRGRLLRTRLDLTKCRIVVV